MKAAGRTETAVLIVAMQHLALTILSDDGIANAAIAEAGERLQQQAAEIAVLRHELEGMVNLLDNLRTDGEHSYCYAESRSKEMVYVADAIDSARALLDRPR